MSQFSDEIFMAFEISVSFSDQKKGVKMDRTATENTNDGVMSPVLTFGHIVHRSRTHTDIMDETPICT